MTLPRKPTARPSELQDWLNARVYHPLSGRLAVALAPTPVTPNMVSVCGGLLIVAAAFAYTELARPLSVAIGLFLHLSWHVVDGADGDLARMTGRTSPIGEVVDGASDYLGHVVLYVVLTIGFQQVVGGWAWVIAVAAGASHVLQTNHAESQKRVYLWWAYGVPWLKQARARRDALFDRRSWFAWLAAPLVRSYLALAVAMNRSADAVDASFVRAGGDIALTDSLRAEVRAHGCNMLFWSKFVGPNPRAFLLGGAMALGSVGWFFASEIILLNILLVIAMIRQRAENRALAVRLNAMIPR